MQTKDRQLTLDCNVKASSWRQVTLNREFWRYFHEIGCELRNNYKQKRSKIFTYHQFVHSHVRVFRVVSGLRVFVPIY